MAKFCGAVGFGVQTEVTPGVWQESIVTRNYYGDLIRNTRRLQSSSTVNDDINVSNEISVLADPYIQNNFHSIRFVSFMGSNWKVSSVEVQYPRLILTLGGVWNGESGPSESSDNSGGTPWQS